MTSSVRQSSLDLAVIGNCQVAGLIDEVGRLVWACLPRPDADPAFCSLLDRHGGTADRGVFAFELTECVRHEQRYRTNTAVVDTTLTDGSGARLRITDFCPRSRESGRMFRPATIVRILEPIEGRPRVAVRFRPAANYGATAPELAAGSHHLSFDVAGTRLRVTTDASLAAITEQQYFVVDAPLAFVLGPDEPLSDAPLAIARRFLDDTINYWQEWVRGLAIPVDWQEAVIRAAISLKLCTYEDTGAVLAALTTSIPEAPGSQRNWDYRYCWLRDSYFVVQALNKLGATRTMEGFLRYIGNLASQVGATDLQPVYGISGNARLEETIADSLDGYRGEGPVRIGNDAYRQNQHDVYGAVILAASQSFFDARLKAPGDVELFTRLEALGERAVVLWDRPDSGPWEFRGRQHVHTYSAAMCWAACDRLHRIAQRLGLNERGERWRRHAESLAQRTLEAAWNPARNAFMGTFDGEALDATALLLPEIGIVSASDARFRSTLQRVETELCAGDLLYRYRHADDFGVPSTAFTVCSFWRVNALAAQGRLVEARESFERMLSWRNPLGLLSEDIDPKSGELWGNYPQTYSMVGIIESAIRLSRTWQEVL